MKKTFGLPAGIGDCLQYLQEVFDSFKLKKAEKNKNFLHCFEVLLDNVTGKNFMNIL